MIVAAPAEAGYLSGAMSELLDDPWIAAQIDAAVAAYAGRLPEPELAWMRAQLAEALAADERAGRLLRGARPVDVDQSGEVRRDAAGRVMSDAPEPEVAVGGAPGKAGGVVPFGRGRKKAG